MPDYSREQLYDAMRRADAAGDGEAVKALAAALKAGAGKPEILDIAKQNNLTVDEAALDANIASRDAGGPVSEFKPPERSNLQYLGDATVNALAGAAQGVAGIYDMGMSLGNLPTYGFNAISRGVGNALEFAGAESVGGSLVRGADRLDARLDNQPTASGAIEQAFPTPEGMGGARLFSQFMGGMAVPFGPKGVPRPTTPRLAVTPRKPGATEAAEIVAAGEREGVRVMTSDVKPPKTFIGKSVRAIGERIPYAGTGGPRMKQNEERVEAVKKLAADFGVDASEEVLDSVTEDLAKTRGGKLTALANRKKAVIGRIDKPFDAAPNTVRAINEQVRKLKGIDAKEYAPVIERLQQFGEQITSGKTLEQVEGQRKLLGELFADQSLAKIKGEGQKAINALYGPLRDDMGAFIKANGGEQAFKAWKGSNNELAAMAGELNSSAFKSVVNNAETTPENVAKLLFSKKPSDVRRLYANLSPAGQEKAKAAVLHEAIVKSGGIDEVSPQKFANALKSFGKTTGIIFGDDAPRIEGIVRLLRATQQASVAAAAPPTGVQNAPVIGAAVLTDWMGGLGSATTTAGLAGMAARLYESAPVRNLLVGLSRSKPSSPQEGVMLERIGKVLASQEGISAKVANDNIPGRLAAEPGRDDRLER